MNSKEIKTNIEVNIYGTRFTVTVPLSGQDSVRATETEMKAYFKKLRDQHQRKSPTECMAMMAYEYAKKYFALRAEHAAVTEEAEDLLRDAALLCGVGGDETPEINREEYGEF